VEADWKSQSSSRPARATELPSPRAARSTPDDRTHHAAHCSAARLADGGYLVAFETQGPVDFGIGLAQSRDLLEFKSDGPFRTAL